jgi:hypothetical protein
MRDYRDAKTMAKGLRRSLAEHGLELTHSQGLELIAQAFGYDNWNILAAKIEAARPAPAAEKPTSEEPMHCSFCAKSQHDVKLLIAGPGTSICNECVALCDDLVDDNEVERHLKNPAPGVDPVEALEAYLADYTPEQLATYLARARGRIEGSQQAIDNLDRGDDEALQDWLRRQDGPARARVRATLAKQAALWGRSTEVVARVLAARS